VLSWGSLQNRPHGASRNHSRADDFADGRSGFRCARRAACPATTECRGCRGRVRDRLGRRAGRRDARVWELAGCGARKGRAASLGARPSRSARRESARITLARRRRRGCPAAGEQDDDRSPRCCRCRQASGGRSTRCPCTGSDPSRHERADTGQPGSAHTWLVAQGLYGAARSAPEGHAAAAAGHESWSQGRPGEAAGAAACRAARPGEKGRTATAPASTAAEEGLT
jgi:hypothetical protein